MPSVTVAAVLLGSEGEVRRGALAALASLCRPVVIAAEADRVGEELAGLPIDIGSCASPRAGLEAALESTPHLDAVVFLQSDSSVAAGSIRKLLGAFQRARLPIVAARDRLLPALFARRLFWELRELDDAQELKRVIRSHSGEVAFVDLEQSELECGKASASRRGK